MEAPGQQHPRPLLPRGTSPEDLNEILQQEPPRIDWTNDLECWLLDGEGKRTRRICGRRRKMGLPTFVPTGISNPHGVKNPFDSYRCKNVAGTNTTHEGIGPCRDHDNAFVNMTIERDFLLGKENAPAESLIGTIDLDQYIAKAKSEITQDDLFSVTRDLWEIEGHKQILKEQMKARGASDDDVETYLRLITQKSQVQLNLARRDAELLKIGTIAAVIELFTAGILHVVREEVGNEAAGRCLDRFEKEVIIPTESFGFSEVRRRFMAVGLITKAPIEAVFSEEKERGEN